jgi:uncharacterized membrane protein
MSKRSPKPAVVHEPETSDLNHLGLERLIFFSDAVFAIAITLLVLDIRLPSGVETANNAQLLQILLGLWQKYFAYIVSFWVIGLYWISHHRKFLYIKRFTPRLLRLNLLLLMVTAFIPFPTTVISESGTRTATIFYALVMALGGVSVAFLWWYASHNHNLVDPRVSKQLVRQEMIAPLITAAIFLASIGVAFWDNGLARLFWVILLPASLIINARRKVE